jgi:hypothetical protein
MAGRTRKQQDAPNALRCLKNETICQQPCYVTSDATIEVVGQLLAENPHGLILSRDELDGWAQSFVRYKGRAGGTDRPYWLELHRAGTLRIHRVNRPALTARRACCSVTGTIQPQILARALDDDALAAGLGARLLMAMPPARKRVWTEAEVADELAEKYANLLKSLLANELADTEKRRPHFFPLSPKAKAIWTGWVPIWGDATDAAEGEQAAALAKLEGYAARLALVHHIVSITVDKPSALVVQPITETSLRAAIRLVEWFAGEAGRVYTILRETAEERDCRRLVEWIEARGGSTTPRDLHRANAVRWPTSEHAELALDALALAELGEWGELESGPSGGRPTRKFTLFNASHPTKPKKTN